MDTVVYPPTPWPTGRFWWLRNGDSWHAPEINNGEPYLPGTKAQWLRDFYWFCRNPIGNFMGFVIGVEGYGYTVYGPFPASANTGRDCVPQQFGFRWSILKVRWWFWLPFVSYWGGRFEFYLGWRPGSGGFGLKTVWRK